MSQQDKEQDSSLSREGAKPLLYLQQEPIDLFRDLLNAGVKDSVLCVAGSSKDIFI